MPKGQAPKIRKDDADGAYLQASLDESKREQGLYADLPRCMWPDGSGAENLRHPVFRMHVSQYGIDDAGFNWDRYSRKKLIEKDFHPYYDISLSLFDHFPADTDLSKLKSEGEPEPSSYPVDDGIISQYVDDFLSGEDEGSSTYSDMISALKFKSSEGGIEYRVDLGRYVGATWEGVNSEPDAEGVYHYASQQILYIDTFIEKANKDFQALGQRTIREYDTPALANESKRCTELDDTPGVFRELAPSIVCALLYVARCTRLDVLFPVCRLTRYIAAARWMVRQDNWLYRVLGYLQRTSKMKLHYQIYPPDFEEGGDGSFECWADSDLGGCDLTKRSTSGGCALLVGSKSRALVEAHCKRQGQTGLSTPDAETCAMVVMGKKAIPLHMMAQRLFKRAIKLEYKGDNSASERIIGTGISQALTYMKRTAALSLTWAHENMARWIGRTPTNENISDIFTKPLELDKLAKFRTLLGIY